METFAFVQVAVAYEDPAPTPELKAFQGVSLNPTMIATVAGVAAAAAIAATPHSATATTAPLKSGSSGEAVQAVQKALGLAADGKYGAETAAAVTDFQLRQGLQEIDGVVGQETAKALGLDEQYRPVGYVTTNTGIGLNIRGGPGLDYRVWTAAPDGAFLDQDYETVIYNDGYAWTPLYEGGWVASDYTTGYSTVAYYEDADYSDDYYYDDYYRPVSYDYGNGGCYRPTAYYNSCYRPVAYYNGGCGS